MASSPTSLLFVAADIIITVSWSSSPTNIIKTTGCHATIIPVLLVTVPHKTFLHFSTKGDKAASEGSDGKKDGVTPIFLSRFEWS